MLGLAVDQAGTKHLSAIDVFAERTQQIGIRGTRLLCFLGMQLRVLDLFIKPLDDEGLNVFGKSQESRCSHPFSIQLGGSL